MRLTVLALALLPAAAQAQNATTPAPTEPLAQTQSCPAGSAWDAGTGACAVLSDAGKTHNAMGGSGCSYSAAREVTS